VLRQIRHKAGASVGLAMTRRPPVDDVQGGPDSASAIETAERISRPGNARNSSWIILAEAPDEWGAKQALAHFQTQFAEISIESAIYVLEYDISAAAGV
jgi:hypothetical protein